MTTGRKPRGDLESLRVFIPILILDVFPDCPLIHRAHSGFIHVAAAEALVHGDAQPLRVVCARRDRGAQRSEIHAGLAGHRFQCRLRARGNQKIAGPETRGSRPSIAQTCGFPARSPAPSLSSGTVQMSNPLSGLNSMNTRRLPSAVKENGNCALLL